MDDQAPPPEPDKADTTDPEPDTAAANTTQEPDNTTQEPEPEPDTNQEPEPDTNQEPEPEPEPHQGEPHDSGTPGTEVPTAYAELTEVDPMSDDTSPDPNNEAAADQLPPPPPSPDTSANDPNNEAAADQLPPPPPSPDTSANQLPPPPPGGGGQAGPRRLERSADRKIAGVAGGIAEYFNLDPVLIRLAFVIAMFAGGIGVIAYVIAWIVLPESERPPAPRVDRNFDTTTTIAVVLLAVAAVLAFADSFKGGFVIPLLLVGGGVYLLTQRESASEPSPLPPPPANTPPRPDDTTRFASAPPTTASERRFSQPLRESTAATTTLERPAPPYSPPTDHAAAEAPERRQREPAVVTRITLSLLALLFAGAIAGDQLGWFDADVSTVAAIGLVGTGVALVVSAFIGRSRGLILVGIVLALAFAATSVLEPIAEDGVGDRSYTPTSLSELEDEYKLGVGELEIDLRELQIPAGERVEVDVELGIGEARVLLPPLTDIELTGDVGVGKLELLGEVEDGIGNDLRVVRALPGEGELLVNLDVGIGHGVVRRD